MLKVSLLNSDSSPLFEQKGIFLTLAGVVLVQVVLAFQGFDVCDDGFAATFYQQFFNDADSVEYNFVYWLSGLIGGIWYQIFPSGGVLWLRILAIAVNTSTFYLAYRLFRPYINDLFLLPGLVMTLFINDFGYLLFYNNHITAFLAGLSMLLLHRGLLKNNLKYLFFSGLLIGLNVFSRIPNLTQFALVLVFPIWFGMNRVGFKQMIKPISHFKIGFFAAFVIVAVVLWGLGQMDLMRSALLGLFDLGNTDNSSHNISDLLQTYLRNYLKVGFYLLSAVFVLVLCFALRTKINYGWLKWMALVVLLLGSFKWFDTTKIYGFYALGYLGVFGVLIITERKDIRLLIFMALVMQLLLPVGSSGGITNIGYASLWLSIPLFYLLIQHWSNGKPFLNQISRFREEPSFKGTVFILSFFSVFAVLKIHAWSQQAYFDPGSRLNKTYKIRSSFAKGIYTTKERATILNELLDTLPKYVSKNDYLFVFDKTPMIHFLTETRPYMYNSWPWIYDAISFEKKLKKARVNRNKLPVVIVQKFETIGSFSAPQSDYLSSDAEDTYLHTNKTSATMTQFLKENEYIKDWSNDYFEIYIPELTD